MKLVVIESPYAGDVEKNLVYLKECIRHSLSLGEAPYASHLFFTQPGILDDTAPAERALGIAAGLAWQSRADLVAVYHDKGISKGMWEGIENAQKLGIPITMRSLYVNVG